MSDTNYLIDELKALREYTKSCRDDMHEPDEQGIRCLVTWTVFDNAWFDNEIKITLQRTDAFWECDDLTINLCDLIAMARI
jgi:hypothetical protein